MNSNHDISQDVGNRRSPSHAFDSHRSNQGKAYDEIGNRLASNNDREPAQPADAIKNATRHGLRENQEQRQTKNGKGWITPTHIFRSHPQGKERPAEQIKSCLDWQNDPKHEPRTVEKDETNCGH